MSSEMGMVGWQPIETAPKDGTRVLLYAEAWSMSWGEVQLGYYHAGEWHTGEGSVAENDPDFDPQAEVGEDYDPVEDANDGPTHWQSLPDPPALSDSPLRTRNESE